MANIRVGRYSHPSVTHDWQGWIEPDDMTWIVFIRADGVPIVYLDRDPKTGAIVQR